jgi:tetratricopeptide (TPR) repeat protein
VGHGNVLQLRDHDLDGAEREYRMALRLNAQNFRPIRPIEYDAYVGLGQVALLRGHEAEALDYFEKAVHLLPNFGFAYQVLGSVYFPRGDYARAAGYFQLAVRSNPLETSTRFYLGTCLRKIGQPREAAEQFHAAREVDPEYSQAYTAEAAALEAAGDKASAARVRSEMHQGE